MKNTDIEDIYFWPDGTWCYRYEFEEMQYMSDDYLTYYFGTNAYDKFLEELL